MRMKKLMILAVAAVALVACSRTFEKHETEGVAIGFGTWSEHLTKAREQGSSTFVATDNFAVYGTKDRASGAPIQVTVFDATVVTASGSGTLTWDYDDHRYWDSSYDSYTFYAVSPAGCATVTATTGAVSATGLNFTGKNNDILVADKTTVEKGTGASSTWFNSYGDVNLVFNHAAALVDVKVKKASTLTDAVGISSISLDNIKQTGTLAIATDEYDKTISTRTTVPNIVLASWTTSNPDVYRPVDGVTPVYGADNATAISASNQKVVPADSGFDPNNTTENTTPAGSEFVFNHLVVVPQAFGASGNDDSQKITISYTLGTDPTTYTRTLYLADFDVKDNSVQTDNKVASWEPGKHYIFYITIDAHAISFSAEIDDWTGVNGYHYLIN